MEKVILVLVIVLGMMSCNKSEYRNNHLELLKSTSKLSSLSYNVTIRKYLKSHNTNCLSNKVLDSLEIVSNKECDSILETINRFN